tara:strand:- start:787 stop:1017 length:231 start_codon:yes stop_codon:yes gene_type:complete
MSILGKGKKSREQRKLEAIERKENKIKILEETLETPTTTTGQGFNPVKGYNPSSVKLAIKNKKKAINRKKRKLGIV